MDNENVTLGEPLNKNFREPKIRFPEFKDTWEKKKIKQLFKYEQPTKYLVSSEKYVADGIPVLTAGKTFILGYTNETNGIKKASKEKPVILFDDFTTDSRFINFDFKIKSSAAKILTEQNGNDIYFLFHVLKNIDYKPQDHQRHWISIFENFNIFIPSYDEQKKISNFFEIIEERETDISRKIETLKKYKEGLQKLIFSRSRFQKVSLNKIVDFQPKSKHGAGTGIDGGKYPFYLSGDKISSSNEYLCDGCYVIANDGGEANFRITNGKFLYSDHCICFKAKDDKLTNYIYNYLQYKKDEITYIGFVGSGLKNIDRDYFENLNIPIVCDDETNKISNLFICIDKIISIYEEKVNKLKKTKSELLKDMFI